jgi:serine/threonine protein kinase
MLFQVNQKIGNYTLIKFLGEGGFGEVWLAENHNNPASEKVAIKLPRKEQIDLQTVKDEIFNWTLSGKHKNILPIIECETFGNQIAIVSEFAPDGSLQDLLKKHRVFSVADAVEISIGVLDGLAHLHNRKIIHRDLKPDNVLFQGRTPRLTDFGISRAMPLNSQSQTVSGTLAYMALECFDGKRNEQTDIWAVGAILYELLTGTLPFSQKTQEQRIFAMVMNEPQLLPDSIPLNLQNIVKKSLAKDLSERYQTAAEMITDLCQSGVSPNSVQYSNSSPPNIPNLNVPNNPDSSFTEIKTQVNSNENSTKVRTVQSSSKGKTNRLYFIAPVIVLLLFSIIGGGYWLRSSLNSGKQSKVSDTSNKSSNPETFKNSIGMEFVKIPAGTFTMGAPKDEKGSEDDERPQHEVSISKEFYMGKYEVTQGQWKAIMKNNPSSFKDCGDDCPVENVSLTDVDIFVSKLNTTGEDKYRLPTEGEWEYACRAKKTDGEYGGTGNLDEMGWYSENSDNKPHPVGEKQPNAFGLFDMHGNVSDMKRKQKLMNSVVIMIRKALQEIIFQWETQTKRA